MSPYLTNDVLGPRRLSDHISPLLSQLDMGSGKDREQSLGPTWQAYLATDGSSLFSLCSCPLLSTSQVPLKMLLKSRNYQCCLRRFQCKQGSSVLLSQVASAPKERVLTTVVCTHSYLLLLPGLTVIQLVWLADQCGVENLKGKGEAWFFCDDFDTPK